MRRLRVRHISLLLITLILLVAHVGPSRAAGTPGGVNIGSASVRITPLEIKVELYDANPRLLPGGLRHALYPHLGTDSRSFGFIEAWRDLVASDKDLHGRFAGVEHFLKRSLQPRIGAVTDGESRLLVVVTANQPGTIAFKMRSAGADAGCLKSPPLGDCTEAGVQPAEMATFETSGVHVAVALYKPPRVFGEAPPGVQRLAPAWTRHVRGQLTRELPLENRTVELEATTVQPPRRRAPSGSSCSGRQSFSSMERTTPGFRLGTGPRTLTRRRRARMRGSLECSRHPLMTPPASRANSKSSDSLCSS
jgi:hypothetical protein